MSVAFLPRFQTNVDAASYAAARFRVKTPTHRQRTVATIHLNTTITPTHTSTLLPLATQHFVQETFLLGGPMRKVLSILGRFNILTGRRPKMTSDEARVVLAKKLHADKSLDIDDICKTLRISRSTFYRYLRL